MLLRPIYSKSFNMKAVLGDILTLLELVGNYKVVSG